MGLSASEAAGGCKQNERVRANNPRELACPPRPLGTVRLAATWVWEGWDECEEWVRAAYARLDFLPQPGANRDPPKRILLGESFQARPSCCRLHRLARSRGLAQAPQRR